MLGARSHQAQADYDARLNAASMRRRLARTEAYVACTGAAGCFSNRFDSKRSRPAAALVKMVHFSFTIRASRTLLTIATQHVTILMGLPFGKFVNASDLI